MTNGLASTIIMTTQKTTPTGNYLEARLVVSIYLVVSTKLVLLTF